MLKIKLTRIGRKGQPQYRIVVSEARTTRDTKVNDTLGFYNPLGAKSVFDLDKTKYNAWLAKGAKPTETIRKLALSTKTK